MIMTMKIVMMMMGIYRMIGLYKVEADVGILDSTKGDSFEKNGEPRVWR